jgi:hypothetical protein
MDIRPLHTDDDYRAALADVSALVDRDPEPGTPEGDHLEVLAALVERYEAEHFRLERRLHTLRVDCTPAKREVTALKGIISPPAKPVSIEEMEEAVGQHVRDMASQNPQERRPALTVRALIAQLNTLPPDARVIVEGYEGGFDDVLGAELRPIIADGGYRITGKKGEGLGAGHWTPRDCYEGEHTEAAADDRDDPDYAEAVYLEARRAR